MSARQYPEVGAEIIVQMEKGVDTEVRITHLLGAGRLFQVANGAGEYAILLIQPDGGWWMVREFMFPDDERWKGIDNPG